MTDIRPISYGPARGGLGEIVSVTPGPARDPEETAMTDLITFLRAQLDDEAAHAEMLRLFAPSITEFVTAANGSTRTWPDPARVLAEVEAKRRILELHPHERFREPFDAASRFEDDHRPAFDEDPRYVGCRMCDWDHRMDEVTARWWCLTVRLLALPFSDRPGYDETWRPA